MSTLPWDLIQYRAQMLARIRFFFYSRGVTEVTTPALQPHAALDPHIRPICAESGSKKRYLHTSPEAQMKPLLAFHRKPIYQICPVWREAEHGRWHNPEFTLLEWYRPNWSTGELRQEVKDFIKYTVDIDLSNIKTYRYRDLFVEHLNRDPHEMKSPEQVDRLFVEKVIENMDQEHFFVHEYPKNQAAQARVIRNRQGHEVADRFELYLNKVEIANGNSELRDSRELEARLKAEQGDIPISRALLAATDKLPESCGVAVGIDRLLAMAANKKSLREVV